MTCFSDDGEGGVYLMVKAKPRAAKPGVEGEREGALVVRLASPPAEGAANEELLKILSKALKVPKTSLKIVQGTESRVKRVRAPGLSAKEAASRLGLSGG